MRRDYNKLVRDRIPEIIRSGGKQCGIETMPEAEYRQALLQKLVEEAQEARQAAPDELITELADLQEVIAALLARNQMPKAVCQECGEPAKWLCIECLYDENKTGHLCDEHAEEHPHDNYGEPMPLFNSPRTGMCGYDGPAEPLY